jgi:hypothetical protein
MWVAMVCNSVRVAPGHFHLVDFFVFVVLRFAGTRESQCKMAFMRCAHAKSFFCRAAGKPRTIVRPMHKNATGVTGLNQSGHIADTGASPRLFFAMGRDGLAPGAAITFPKA